MTIVYLMLFVSLMSILAIQGSRHSQQQALQLTEYMDYRHSRSPNRLFFHAGELLPLLLIVSGYLYTAWLTYSLTPFLMDGLNSDSINAYLSYALILVLFAASSTFAISGFSTGKAYLNYCLHKN